MADGLHVLDVVFQSQKLTETEHGKHFDGGFLFAYELRFNLLQTGATGNVDDFADQCPGQAASAKFGMNQHTHTADMPFPTSELLMQCGIANDLAANQG